MNVRIVLLLALGAGIGAGVWWLSQAPDRPQAPGSPGSRPVDPVVTNGGTELPEREPFFAAAECRACHEAVYAEWERSYHGMAWTDPMVQALSEGFRKPECIDCHAPQPIHITGVDQRVAPRQHGRSDGVDCLSCHLLEDGVSVAATRTLDTSATPGACRPVEVGTMAVSTVCAGCHNQHETVDELLASGLEAECQTCHMPEVERTVGEGSRTGRSHVFPGAHDEEMHRRAVTLAVRVEGRRVLADVTNVGAGHKVPTDARHRSYNLWVDAWDARGNPWVTDAAMTDGEFRLYYRDDFRPSTQIAHQQTRTGTWEVPDGFAGRVRVRLTYALNPEELRLRRVYSVHESEVTIP